MTYVISACKAGGTIHSMSPEMAAMYRSQLRKDESALAEVVTYPSDFYSLGILAYELINGSPPYGYCVDTDKEAYLKTIIDHGVTGEQLTVIQDKVSVEFLDLIRSLTIKDPTQRIGDWAQFRAHTCFSSDIKYLAEKLVEEKDFKLSEEWVKKYDDILDFIQVTGKFRKTEDPIDEEAQKLFDDF